MAAFDVGALQHHARQWQSYDSQTGHVRGSHATNKDLKSFAAQRGSLSAHTADGRCGRSMAMGVEASSPERSRCGAGVRRVPSRVAVASRGGTKGCPPSTVHEGQGWSPYSLRSFRFCSLYSVSTCASPVSHIYRIHNSVTRRSADYTQFTQLQLRPYRV